MKVTKWKQYKSLNTGLVHYVSLDGSNYEAQVYIIGRGGKELKNKGYYHIQITNGYNGITNKQVIGLKESKIVAEKMLVECFNEVQCFKNNLK